MTDFDELARQGHPATPCDECGGYDDDCVCMEVDIPQLRRLLIEAAEEIEANVKIEYRFPAVHPSMQRKFDRDMALTKRLRIAARAGVSVYVDMDSEF